MADAIELAKAYIQLVPTTKNIGNNIEELLGSGEAGEGAKKAGSGLGSKLADGLKGAASVIAGAAAGAIGAGAAGLTALTKGATEAYAEFEQLNGGAELMWGEAYDFIASKAATAFSDVQMSTNDYLTAANYYATGLTTALGGNETAAAELADSIITAQADIVSATGASSESVSNAFNGVMRGNYTMLDNLGLGIAGTKEGMQGVIDEVNAWMVSQGEAGNLTIDSMADCEQALVSYVEMQGMAEYAAAEGTQTIEGSQASLLAAWDNMLVSLGQDNADIGLSVQNLSDTASAYLTNISGVVMQILPNIATAFSELAVTAIPLLVTTLGELAGPMAEGIMTIATTIIGMLPQFLEIGGQFVSQLISGAVTLLPDIVTMAIDLVMQIVTAIGENLPSILTAGVEIVTSLITAITEKIPDIIQTGVTLLVSLVQAMPTIVQSIVEALPQIITGIVNGILGSIPVLIQAGVDLLVSLVSALPQIINTIVAALPTIITSIVDGLTNNDVLGQIIEAGITIMPQLAIGFVKAIPEILKMIPTVIKAVIDALGELAGAIVDIGVQVISGLWQGISNSIQWLKDMITGWVGNVLDFIKNLFGIHSPSKKMAWVGKMLDEGLAGGIEDNVKPINDAMDDITDMTTGSLTSTISAVGSVDVKESGRKKNSEIDTLITAVRSIEKKMDNLKVVMDGNAVVGQIGSKVDKKMGESITKSIRRMAY